MSLRIGSVSPLQSSRHLTRIQKAIARAMERLSSGSRVNRAGEDSVGLSQSVRLDAQARALYRGTLNINETQSYVQQLSSDLDTIRSLVSRLKEIALQSSNGTLTEEDRENLDQEFQQLRGEVIRLIEDGTWNQANNNPAMKVQVGSSSQDSLSLLLPKLQESTIFQPTTEDALRGDGTFTVGATFAMGAGFSVHRVANFTNDSNMDILTTNSGTGTAVLWKSAGNGSFTATGTATFGAGYSVLGFYDINGDGLDDVVGQNSASNISVYLSNGSGGFTHTGTIATGAFGSASWTDLDGDGDLDLSVANATNILIYTNQGAGVFTQSSTTAHGMGASPTQYALYDFNNDGFKDVLLSLSATTTSRIYLNDGSNSLTLSQTLNNSTGTYSIISDLDRDGYMDIEFMPTASGGYQIYQGNGNGTFVQRLTTTTANTRYASTDFNQDGEIDYVSYDQTSGVFRSYLGNGAGVFTQSGTLNLSAGGFVYATDLDGDGLLDDITMMNVGGGTSSMLLNNGVGVFTEIATLAYPGFGGNFAYGDNNSDGIYDIFLASSVTGQMVYFAGTGTGGVTTANLTLGSTNGFFTRDLNGDGYGDIFTLQDATGTFYSYYQDPETKFYAPNAPVSLGTQSNIYAGDINGDGILDVVARNAATGVITSVLSDTRTITTPIDVDLNVLTQESSEELISVLDSALNNITEVAGELGAIHSRLDFAASSNLLAYENIQEAKSMIADTDYALEIAELVRLQILEQAQVAVLAQSNLNMRLVTSLLENL